MDLSKILEKGGYMTLIDNSYLIVNIFLIVFLIYSVNKGYKRGLVLQILGLFSMLIAATIAWVFYIPFGSLYAVLPKSLAPFQNTNLSSFFYEKSNAFLWFVIIFLLAFFIIKLLAKVLNIITKTPGINFINRMLGVVFSLINYTLIVGFLIFVLSLPFFKEGNQIIDNSYLRYNEEIINQVQPLIIKPLKQLQSTQKIFTKPRQASTQDIENMQNWLIDNRVTTDEVKEFFKEIIND